MARRTLRDKRALSPVIATVILVAVTIVVAVAVAYWMGGIAGLYTRMEKLQIQSAYATSTSNLDFNGDGTGDGVSGWNLTITVKNAGTADATIDYIVINGKPYNSADYVSNVNVTQGINLQTPIGQTKTVIILIKSGAPFTAGTSIEVKLHSAAGMDYTQLISLP